MGNKPAIFHQRDVQNVIRAVRAEGHSISKVTFTVTVIVDPNCDPVDGIDFDRLGGSILVARANTLSGVTE